MTTAVSLAIPPTPTFDSIGSDSTGPARPVEAIAPPVSWWEQASFTAVHAVATGILRLTGLRGLYFFGAMFGTLEWLINYRRRRKFIRALKRVLGRHLTDGERRHWTRDHFIKSRCDKLFYLVLDRIPRERAAGLLTVGNENALRDAFAREKGVCAATSHHGALHVVAMLLFLRGFKVAGVRDRSQSGLRRFVQRRFDLKYPELGRARILYADSFPREIFRCYREGYLVGSAMDISKVRDPNQRMEEVTIFGESKLFLSGPLRIALRCGTTIFQTFIRLEPGFRYRIDFVGPLVDPTVDHDEDSTVTAMMRTYAANIEKNVRSTPSLMTKL